VPGLPQLEAPLGDGVVSLREWAEPDADRMVPLLNEPEIVRWTRVPSPYTRADAEEYLARMEHLRRRGDELALAIVDAANGDLLGSISVRVTSREHSRGELGYLVFAPARGRDAATRAVRLLARFAFERLGLERVEIFAATANAASQRVAEKAGFTREGVLRSARYSERQRRRVDFAIYSLLPGELARHD
jgi:RimJ/RimL family protein N-acetyltransferase